MSKTLRIPDGHKFCELCLSYVHPDIVVEADCRGDGVKATVCWDCISKLREAQEDQI